MDRPCGGNHRQEDPQRGSIPIPAGPPRVGGELTMLPPAGRFLLEEPWKPGMPDDVRRPLVFLAAGSGMVPIFSLLKKALAGETAPGKADGRQASGILLITQHRDESSILFKKALEGMVKKNGERFRWISLLSRPGGTMTPGDTCAPRHGRLNNWLPEVLLREEWPIPEQKHDPRRYDLPSVYLCGPPAFMRMAQFTLRLMGFPDTQGRKENFTVEYIPPAPLLTDTMPKMITVFRKDSIHRFEAAWPDTILRAAERHHLLLPYSCRGGRCSTCTAKCLSGKVKMSINEVLTEKDLQDGLVLPCVGYAETDLELEY
jgi:ring-1,2-phenylacetyl-CoA epoxidase subunit PaaE